MYLVYCCEGKYYIANQSYPIPLEAIIVERNMWYQEAIIVLKECINARFPGSSISSREHVM